MRLPFTRAAALLIAALTMLPAASALAAAAAPFTIEDLVRLKRLSDPAVSPDGRHAVFALRETDIEANRGVSHVWIVDLDGAGAQARQLTRGSASDMSPHWAPDGRSVFFLSARSGSTQVWRLPLAGGEAQPVTSYPLEVGSFKVSPQGDRIALTLGVMAGCDTLQCTHERLLAAAKRQPAGQIYDRLFVRHWDTWSDGTRSHLFTAHLKADGTAELPLDLSARLDGDVPQKPFGDEADYDFSPDGRTLVFSIRIAGKSEPWSTNFDLYAVATDGSGTPQNLTADNPAWDAQPVFLANSDLAYLAMDRPGFEADRFHIVIRDGRTGAKRALTAGWDRSVSHLARASDGRNLLAIVEDVGQTALYAVDVKSGTPRKLVGSGQVSAVATGAGTTVIAWATLAAPADLFSVPAKAGEPHRLTAVNAALMGERAMSEFEQFSFKGWNDETVHGYVMKPYGFSAGKRYPTAFLIHGGPQGSFGNEWGYRWNPQVFAGAGYGVVMVDFHGSTGYGQAFTDSISRDWGGKPLEDLRKGLAAATARYGWLDADKACALGASYGGFMINWIAGQWNDRFRCLVNHDGVFEMRSMYYSTEELWFAEWEFGGTYYDAPQLYEKFNPANFVSAWRTPMLVVHGDLDYRVPLTQGLGAFTALQRRGIESRLLYFPDENHWVLKSANSVQWYHTVLGWLDQHLK